MRRGGAGKKRDANEQVLVEALRAYGCEIWRINGAGLPDLLVRYRGRYFVGEVKSKAGKLTAEQLHGFPVWRTVEEALVTIGVKTR